MKDEGGKLLSADEGQGFSAFPCLFHHKPTSFSLISHNFCIRRLSRAADAGCVSRFLTKYFPVTVSTSDALARYTDVSAPSFGLMPVMLAAAASILVVTAPGCRLFAVMPTPFRRSASVLVKRTFASLDAA